MKYQIPENNPYVLTFKETLNDLLFWQWVTFSLEL